MIDRAAVAGMAIGAGAVLIAQQLFVTTPQYIPIAIGFVLVLTGLLLWGDLRFLRERQERVDRHAETDR